MSLRMASVFCDHMVLQQGIALPVWGWSVAGDRITVRFGGVSRSAVADRAGAWTLVLPALKSSPVARSFVVRSRITGQTIALQDVLVGEVWLCSGQSNMEWPMVNTAKADEELDAAEYPAIRLFTVPHRTELDPSPEFLGRWDRCQRDSVANFSAVGYFFGREIHRQIGVPVGLINASWGGTIAEAWSSRAALVANPVFRKVIRQYEAQLAGQAKGGLPLSAQSEWARQHDHKDTVNAGADKGWHGELFDDSAWSTMDLPRNWQSAGHEHSGIFWFRRVIEVPADWAGRELTLGLGPTDKSDVTYFNGVEVGSLTMEQRSDAWCTPRVYTVPGPLVKAGRNVVAVRVFSNIFHGGFVGEARQMKVGPGDDPATEFLPLAGPWRYQVEADFGLVPPPPPPPPGPGNPNSPAMLYDNMIKPIIPFALRGAIWYQGESNAERARQYRTLFPLMIRSWRDAWKQGKPGSVCRDFPFLFVQLANFMLPPNVPCESAWAELREAQRLTLREPNTAMAVAIDLGEAQDIHPRNKQDVGLRLARQALARVYGFKDLVASGPSYEGMTREKSGIRLRFGNIGGGLVARGGRLKGFAVAGADRVFVWADAVIDPASESGGDRDTVRVSSPLVAKPVAVRYGWDNNPECTLFNSSGLPASPFKTDAWPGITA